MKNWQHVFLEVKRKGALGGASLRRCIIFGDTIDPLCKEFAVIMSSEFEIIMMGT